MKETQILEEAKTYLEKDLTLKETAKVLNVHIRTLQIHIKKLAELDPSLYTLVLEKQKSNMISGRKRGGELGKRSPSYTKEEAISYANLLIHNQMTYQEMAEVTGIPSSTIYDMVHSSYVPEEVQIQIQMVADANHHGLTMEDYQRNRIQK